MATITTAISGIRNKNMNGIPLDPADALDGSVIHLIAEFKKAHGILTGERDLSLSNPTVSLCLKDLFDAVMECPTDHDSLDLFKHGVGQEKLVEVRNLLHCIEYTAELSYVLKCNLSSHIDLNDLDKYPTRDRYRALVSGEVQTLNKLESLHNINGTTNIVFVGSGPLPITAIEFHLQTGSHITCIDHNEEATTASSKFVERLGLSDRINVQRCCGTKFDFKNADIVYIAAMVGNYEDVIDRIKETAPRATIAIRSSEGVRALIYRPVDSAIVMQKGYDIKGKTDPAPPIKNATIFLQNALPS